MPIADSELILNQDGSIYHLNLTPDNIAKTIILVGDPDRVDKVTDHFDSIRFKTQKREFRTQTGFYKNKELTVISTGIGASNIDIVLNELDALCNIDLYTKQCKTDLTSLQIIRIGTSGAIQEDIPVDSFLVSEYAIGLDNVLHYYEGGISKTHPMQTFFMKHTKWDENQSVPYITTYNPKLGALLQSEKVRNGITVTNVGFYGPQGRKLRLPTKKTDLNKMITSFEYEGKKITNFEMETSAIYGLSNLLGHQAVSMNAILANRVTGEFSKNPATTVDHLIRYTLEKIANYT